MREAPAHPLRLFYSPGACSLSCHIALEESGLPYEAVRIETKTRQNYTPDYLAINPWGKVPALEQNGQILTEAAAILAHVADLVPERSLLPGHGTVERARAHEWLNFLSSSVHVAYRSIFRPERLAGDDETAIAAVRRKGGEGVAEAMVEVERRIGDGPFALGLRFSLCDAYILVFHRWSLRDLVADLLPPLPRLRALAARAEQRPSVGIVLRREAEPAG